MRVLVVSTYELGNQPHSAATAVAALDSAGHEVRCADLAVDPLSTGDLEWAERVAFSVPMHTAMRLAIRVVEALKARRPGVPVCLFGLYAGAGGQLPEISAPDAVIAGEYEPALVAWADGGDPGPTVQLPRGASPVPDRSLLPGISSYSRLVVGGEERLVGSVVASRGCSHRCRHCPVPVVYAGRVRPVEEPVVIADVDQLVAAGARHLSFGDPDFFNLPRHSLRVVSAIHARHPDVTFDATIKVEHLLRHRGSLHQLAGAGCAFVVSAFESVDDRLLDRLDKGHTAADASEAVIAARRHGIEIRPSWLPFTPWTTASDLVDLLDFVVAHDLVGNVDPVQYTVRLLIPDRSLMLADPGLGAYLGDFDHARLGWTWAHPDPALDRLQEALAQLVEERVHLAPEATFEEIDGLVRSAARLDASSRPRRGSTSMGPDGQRAHLSEPWFCCSEPTRAQLAPLEALGSGG
jgi:radical SAM superfamily enzyme YgiQ (UPF0313 family)